MVIDTLTTGQGAARLTSTVKIRRPNGWDITERQAQDDRRSDAIAARSWTIPSRTASELVHRLTSLFVLDELSHWLTIPRVDITWDEAKNTANRKKHGVSFEEAQELLLSEREHLVIFDEEHSIDEDRFISIGPIRRGLVLVVWTERDLDVLRVISARWATPNERQLFYSHIGRPQ